MAGPPKLLEQVSAAIRARRYQDLIDDPVAMIERLYRDLEIPYDDAVGERVRRYLAHKPKDKHGVHRYKALDPSELAQIRPHFRRYQERYGVPDEQ